MIFCCSFEGGGALLAVSDLRGLPFFLGMRPETNDERGRGREAERERER